MGNRVFLCWKKRTVCGKKKQSLRYNNSIIYFVYLEILEVDVMLRRKETKQDGEKAVFQLP